MKADGNQAKTACGNLQLCAGLKASIEGDTYVLGQRRFERLKSKRNGEKEARDSDEEEDNGGLGSCLNNLTIETAVMEEEAAENLQEGLEMETEEEGGNVN